MTMPPRDSDQDEFDDEIDDELTLARNSGDDDPMNVDPDAVDNPGEIAGYESDLRNLEDAHDAARHTRKGRGDPGRPATVVRTTRAATVELFPRATRRLRGGICFASAASVRARAAIRRFRSSSLAMCL